MGPQALHKHTAINIQYAVVFNVKGCYLTKKTVSVQNATKSNFSSMAAKTVIVQICRLQKGSNNWLLNKKIHTGQRAILV